MKENPKLQGTEWLDIDNMLRELAPNLYQRYKKEMESDTEDPFVYDEIRRLKGFAINMVRYAISPNPNDCIAQDAESGEKLVNPKTKRVFTFNDLSIKREDCIGTSAGIWGREEQVARITVELYRKLHKKI